MEDDMYYSDLELMVNADMYDRGYNSAHPDDIKAYWETMLNDN